ncbi:MAG: hypothetical protein ABUL60_33690 [Myxococcales bacterium]
MRLIRLVPFALVFGLVSACGGSDTSSSGDTGPSIGLEELPAKYADAVCQVFTSCVGDLYDIFRPGETCLKDFSTAVEEGLATLPDAVDAGRVKYHGTKVQKCLDELAAGGCDTLSNRQPESCKAALEGTVETGGDCTMDAECVGQQYCKTSNACPGQCAPYEKAGGACTSNDNCASGLKCGDNRHCVAPSEEGEACEQGEPKCVDGLVCLGQDATAKTPGKCYTIEEALSGKEGEDCSLDGHLCAPAFACEITSIAPLGGQCVAKVDSGAACRAAFPDECPPDEYCALGANPLMPGTCTSKPKAGEACAAALGGGEICAPYTRCDAGVCRDIAHAGEDCNADDTCYSGHCVNKACVTGSSCQ